MKKIIIISVYAIAVFSGQLSATIIDIPDDYLTIQEGIDATSDGDTVLVQPGTYVESVNFNGHNIVLGSLFLITGDTTHISQTRIDGSLAVVRFDNNENNMAKIIGFYITGGWTGILCSGSSPLIAHNIIGGISDSQWYFPAFAEGILCIYSNAKIIDNTIIFTQAMGIGMNADATAYGIECVSSNLTVANNIIYQTRAVSTDGWATAYGFFATQSSNPILTNNIITYTFAGRGAGLQCLNPESKLINSIIRGNSPEEISGSPIVNYCNVEGGWDGEGNIDTDPLFRDPVHGDFTLMSVECGDPYDSPCIDTGSPAIIDSLLDCQWGLGTILSDMGAYGGGDSALVGIDDYIVDLPDKFALLQNYPNPFNPTTTIRYSLPVQSDVRIEIYNILGQKVATLFNGNKQAGYHTVTWQADDYPSGVYFARLETGRRTENIKMVLLK